MYQFGQIEVHPTYIQEKNYQLIVNVLQMSVLSLFNDISKLTYKEIADKTNIPKYYLDTALAALCKPDVQILLKDLSMTPVFDSDDEVITLNMEFSSWALRVNLIPKDVAN